MKILVTGRGTSGSWQIRGEQLGGAIGAAVISKATSVKGFDLAVVVKRTEPVLGPLQTRGLPIVWDIVDAWPQPYGNAWTRDQCMAWLRQSVKAIRPAGIVAATYAMANDCAEFGVPVLMVPHHARPGLQRNPIRDAVKLVGYEGGERYIEGWRPIVERECARRGWQFVPKAGSLADVDIVLGLRDQDGYAPRHWKSGVKLSNAQGSGTPFIGSREAGYLEQAIGGCERWADTPDELSAAFDDLRSHEERERISNFFHASRPALEPIAERYKLWLEDLCCAAGKS